jgi:hypothetical protein
MTRWIMTAIDEFFRKSHEVGLHPRVRNWKERLARAGMRAELELYRPSAALGLSQTEMILHFTERGTPLPAETVAWEDELNKGLVALGVRAIDADQEAERFALGLRGALRQAGKEFGDGFFNAVLLAFVKDSELVRHRKIAAVIEYAYALSPPEHGKAYNVCRQMITDAISGRAQELTGPLKYPEEEAKVILIEAVAGFLDERYSVSSRRRLGLL